MPDLILKAPIFGRISKASRIPGSSADARLGQMIARLDADPTQPQNKLVQIGLDFGFYSSAQQAEHLSKHWLDDPPGAGFWAGLPEVEEIIRKGLSLALKKFRDTGLPLEFFWVISGDENSDRFEISVSVCATVIVVIFHTPQVPCNVTTEHSHNIWLARFETGSVITRKAIVPRVPAPPIQPNTTAPPRARRKRTKKPKRAKRR
jgi:hypothetical protein